MTDINSRDMQIAEAVQKATTDSFYGREVPSLKEIIASVPGDEPVGMVVTVGGYPDDSRHEVIWHVPYKEITEGTNLYASPQPGPDAKKKAELWDYYQALVKSAGFDGITSLLAKYDTNTFDARRKAIEECAVRVENFMRNCLDDKDIQKHWKSIKAENDMRAKLIRELLDTES